MVQNPIHPRRDGVPPAGHLRSALAHPGFRLLYAVRLLGQFGDGVFQASLAGAVLFNPERQAHAADVAAGFAVVLLPYSAIGPFAGVLLDRWRRQRVLLFGNLVRAGCVLAVAAEIISGLHGIPFYASALVVVSIGRFILSALSASLPHVVSGDDLVTANALSGTSGSVVTTAGGAAAIAVRAGIGSSARDYAAIAMVAVCVYLLAAVPASVLGRDALGPDETERWQRESTAEIARGLLAGLAHLRRRRAAFCGLATIAAHRLSFGVATVCTVLLYRNYFADDGLLRAGLAGIGQFVAALAIGGAAAALVTPVAARRLGYVRWPAALLVGAGIAQAGLGLPFTMPLLLLGAVALGFAAQGLKICVDTVVQRDVEDSFRGRIFALYDAMFNIMLVVAAVITAVALPDDGHSAGAIAGVALSYLVLGVAYPRLAARVGATAPQTTA